MGRKKYFTAGDVNSLIPKLEKALAQIDECRRQVQDLVGRLPHQGSPSPMTLDADAQELTRARTLFLMSAVENNVKYIASLGGVVKDLDEGLVDFSGRINGEPVWICWRRGETEVKYWHGLDEGFSERQFLRTEQDITHN